jgi:hypothetical protein
VLPAVPPLDEAVPPVVAVASPPLDEAAPPVVAVAEPPLDVAVPDEAPLVTPPVVALEVPVPLVKPPPSPVVAPPSEEPSSPTSVVASLPPELDPLLPLFPQATTVPPLESAATSNTSARLMPLSTLFIRPPQCYKRTGQTLRAAAKVR